jgi:hypothetical protein
MKLIFDTGDLRKIGLGNPSSIVSIVSPGLAPLFRVQLTDSLIVTDGSQIILDPLTDLKIQIFFTEGFDALLNLIVYMHVGDGNYIFVIPSLQPTLITGDGNPQQFLINNLATILTVT